MKRIVYQIIYFISCLLFTSIVFANHGMYTYAKSNHIYFYSTVKNKIVELTYSGVAHDPVLSSNQRWLAFVIRSKNIIPASCAFSLTKTNYADEIWIINLKTMCKKLLVAGNLDCDHPTKVIIDPHNLQFSPDNKTLYFATSAWATSGAVHAINVDGKNLRFVTDGNAYRVVKNGLYKGDLIVNQHRYRFKGDMPLGSYNWDWLFTPQGKQIKLYSKKNEFY